MSIKSWLKNIKTTIDYEIKSFSTFEKRENNKSKIYPLESEYEMPNLGLEQEIQKSICAIEYCPEDWVGTLLPGDYNSVIKKCDKFSFDGQCKNKDCPVHNANNAYFDAKAKHTEIITARNNSFRRIFGLKEK